MSTVSKAVSTLLLARWHEPHQHVITSRSVVQRPRRILGARRNRQVAFRAPAHSTCTGARAPHMAAAAVPSPVCASTMSMNAAVAGPINAPQGVEAVPLPASASPSTTAKHRGAVVEDMQPGPAVCVFRDASIDRALVVAHDHDYSQLPLVSKERKLLGYVDVAQLQGRVRAGTSQPTDRVDSAMIKFHAPPGGKSRYHVITPQTDLADLEGMFTSGSLDGRIADLLQLSSNRSRSHLSLTLGGHSCWA